MIRELALLVKKKPKDILFSAMYDGLKTKDEWKALVLKSYGKNLTFHKDGSQGISAEWVENPKDKNSRAFDVGFWYKKYEWKIWNNPIVMKLLKK